MRLNKRHIILITFSILVLSILLYLFVNKETVPQVLTIDPPNGSSEIPETKQISIVFNTDISEKTKNKIQVDVNPQIDFDTTWLTSTYKIIPKSPLENNLKYTITVTFNKKEIDKFEFKTTLFNKQVIQEYGPTQTENDYKSAQATLETIEKYPWYPSLPIVTQKYVIFYDFDKDKFAVTFLKPIKDSEDLKSLEAEIENELKNIGVKEFKNYYFNIPKDK